MTDPGYNHETAAAVKKAIEAKLNKGTPFASEEIQNDVAAWLKIERGIFEIYHPVDTDCKSRPPWQRTPNQLVRNTSDPYYTFDEIGLCRRYVTESTGWLSWNQTAGKWYLWTGTHWSDDGADLKAEQISTRLRDTLEYEAPAFWYAGVTKEAGQEKLMLELPKDFKAMQKAAAKLYTCVCVTRAARADLAAKFDSLKSIPFENGMFTPETGELKPHTPENYNTTVCPTTLNLNAAPFPPGEEFFKKISCNDDEWTKALFRGLGRCMLYGNPDQKFYVFYGSGQNGKGVLCDWLQAALGTLVGSCLPAEISKVNSDGRQTSLFDNVPRCRIVLFKEAGRLEFDDEIIKALTGEKEIPLKRIHAGTKTLPVAATPVFISNNLPTSDRGGISMMRRQVGFPFDFQADRPDPDLLQKLATPEGNEWLLCKIVTGLLETLQPGAPSITETLPPRVKQFTADLIKEGDPVYQWLVECCDVTQNETIRTGLGELYKSFCGFQYSKDGMNPTPHGKFRMSQKTLKDRLKGHNLKCFNTPQKDSNGKTCRNLFYGIRLNATGESYRYIEESNPYD